MNQISGIQAALEGDAGLSRHSQDLANSLIEMLQDPDSGVASAAASALRAAASQSDGAFQPAYHYGSTQPCCLAFLVPCFSVPAETHVFWLWTRLYSLLLATCRHHAKLSSAPQVGTC